MWYLIIATIIIGALLLYKLLFSSPANFWQSLGIREIDVSPAAGKLDIFLGRTNMTTCDTYAYKLMGSDKFCGINDLGNPMLLVKDLDLMKKILIKDFDHFVDQRQFFTKADGAMIKMLPNLQGEEWKGVRNVLSPTFSTGKIRRMMEYFNSVAQDWVTEFTAQANATTSGSVVISVQNAVNLYTVDVISNTAFGMNAAVIKNPDSPFMKMVNRAVGFSRMGAMKNMLRLVFPRLSRYLGFSVIDVEAVEFFERILDQALKSRMSGETKRNDFLQLMVEARKGELVKESSAVSDGLSVYEKDARINMTGGKKGEYLTEEIMSAQSVIFFFAGFNTTSRLITFVLYALAVHRDVQDKLREEVDKIVKDDGNLDYDDVGRLVYMDMVVNEVIRKYRSADRLERVCSREYRDPETGMVVPKGTLVGIPVKAIHNDTRYYENPEKFDPEHFSPEKKASRHPYAFLPFGIGPWNCIAMRFALIEVKSALAHMLHNFIIEPTEKTPVPMQGIPAGQQLLPPKDLELKLTPISRQ